MLGYKLTKLNHIDKEPQKVRFFGTDMLNPLWPLTWWRHQMENFPALLAICAGNSPVSGEIPAQRPVTRNFDVYF